MAYVQSELYLYISHVLTFVIMHVGMSREPILWYQDDAKILKTSRYSFVTVLKVPNKTDPLQDGCFCIGAGAHWMSGVLVPCCITQLLVLPPRSPADLRSLCTSQRFLGPVQCLGFALCLFGLVWSLWDTYLNRVTETSRHTHTHAFLRKG